MNVTRYGINSQGSFTNNSDGAYVSFNDYTALKQKLTELAVQLANAESKCRDLAAENAGAKKIISECREYFIAGVMNRIRPTNEGYLHMICDTFEDETPSTDAFLEVRASELDSLAGVAETMLVKFSNQSCSSDMHDVVGWKMVLQQATNRAAQLRKGAAPNDY